MTWLDRPRGVSLTIVKTHQGVVLFKAQDQGRDLPINYSNLVSVHVETNICFSGDTWGTDKCDCRAEGQTYPLLFEQAVTMKLSDCGLKLKFPSFFVDEHEVTNEGQPLLHCFLYVKIQLSNQNSKEWLTLPRDEIQVTLSWTASLDAIHEHGCSKSWQVPEQNQISVLWLSPQQGQQIKWHSFTMTSVMLCVCASLQDSSPTTCVERESGFSRGLNDLHTSFVLWHRHTPT